MSTQPSTERIALEVEMFADPGALTAALGTGPVHRVTLPDGMPTVLVTGHRAAREALTSPGLVRSVEAAAPELRRYHPMGSDAFALSQHMLFADAPDHGRMRALVSAAFTRRRVEALRPRVQAITDRLIDEVVADGEADLVEAVALPLPIAVISELLGVPLEDRADFERYAEVLTGINASSGFDAIIAAGQWFDGYLAALVERRRVTPGDDLLSALIDAQAAAGVLTDIELRSNALLLLSAGFETTVNLIANGMLALLRHPEQLATLAADPALLPGAVDELLRFDSPVSAITYHFARDDLTIAGVPVLRGEHVVISVAAAHHDPDAFVEPARLDVTRDVGARGLAFSHGMHYCLGAPLAKLEGEVAIGALLRRLADIELAVPADTLTWKPTYNLHRLERLPVRFIPAGAFRREPEIEQRRAS